MNQSVLDSAAKARSIHPKLVQLYVPCVQCNRGVNAIIDLSAFRHCRRFIMEMSQSIIGPY